MINDYNKHIYYHLDIIILHILYKSYDTFWPSPRIAFPLPSSWWRSVDEVCGPPQWNWFIGQIQSGHHMWQVLPWNMSGNNPKWPGSYVKRFLGFLAWLLLISLVINYSSLEILCKHMYIHTIYVIHIISIILFFYMSHHHLAFPDGWSFKHLPSFPSYMGGSKNTGTPKWMVYNGNPY